MDKAKINCAKAKETVIHNSYGKNLFDPLCSHISGEGSQDYQKCPCSVEECRRDFSNKLDISPCLPLSHFIMNSLRPIKL